MTTASENEVERLLETYRAHPRNPRVCGVAAEGIRRLFPGWQMDLQRITLLPPLARRLGPATSILYPSLAALPVLRTHYLGLLTRPS